MKPLKFLLFYYLIYFQDLSSKFILNNVCISAQSYQPYRQKLVNTNNFFYTLFIHKNIHFNIKNIHLKKTTKTLSCVPLFSTALYVVFKMNKSPNIKTTLIVEAMSYLIF